jgi:hypothetical protein
MTFVRNHAEGILACDFFVTVTASFRMLYVFVIMEVGTRRIAHVNVSARRTGHFSSFARYHWRETLSGSHPRPRQADEWDVHPHSGNYHFFKGETEGFFDSLIFVNGIRGTTIMGTPLFLAGAIDPAWRI